MATPSQIKQITYFIIILIYINRNNVEFEYKKVSKDELELVYDINVLKLRFKNKKDNFGTLIDLDQTSYEAYEIHFHTPGIIINNLNYLAEHTHS